MLQTATEGNTPQRKIIHIDMDCFYAAVEIRDNPSLRGKPVAVGGRGRRGVLTTASYEARKFGVRSAMPTFMALERCPHLTIVPPRFEAYVKDSRTIRSLFFEYTPHVEPLSLDEAYLDVSHQTRPATEIAKELQQRIYDTTGLTASAGVAPNKLIAKIASDWNKPNGLFVIRPAAVAAFVKNLPVSKIWGIGRKTNERMRSLGIETCAQLQSLELPELQNHFGKFGADLYYLCRGQDDRPVVSHRIRKSLSVERTFSDDLATREDCLEKLDSLFQHLQIDLNDSKTKDRPITKTFLKLKYSDFKKTTIERTGLPCELATYRSLLEEAFDRRPESVRLIGIGVRFANPELPNATQLEFPFLSRNTLQ
ncbi:MAG: DNA polymerase IV [Verrucomicrobiota bacterium]